MMKVILMQDVDYLGLENEVVTIKNGYGRNYLIPKKLAVEATPAHLAKQRAIEKIKVKEQEAMLAKMNAVIDKLQSSAISIVVETGTSGKIFGKVTKLQVSREIKKKWGYEIDRKLIELPEMSTVGTYTCSVKLDKGKHVAELKINLTA